ncbi:MAG: heavy-metal-associated domain-containing protein [Clostridia bacterium]|nr:heavy-metal-associated domain-containing protein [Clostridia bacterium]MCR5693423.1 heavy-metal-associated domain-containing protein [Clostridia bacterium]
MKKYIKIEDLCCANCAAKIEKQVAALEGVNKCSISFMAEKMLVDFDEGRDFGELFAAIKEIANRVEPECTVSI